jgi:hypothetical protein
MGLPVLAVPYEDLVSNPRPVLQAICRHLEIGFHSNLLRHNELPHTELFANGLTVGNTNPKQPISNGSVGQWVDFFSERDLGLIDRIAGSSSGSQATTLASSSYIVNSSSSRGCWP